eukprot:m.26205 g.26205  ORF g.26205 m.26205 type:complete len:215 (+) comp9249_c0_seq2:118-762(+)
MSSETENNNKIIEAPKERSWEQVLEDLRAEFDKGNVCIEHVQDILNSYKTNEQDWQKYALFDDHCYTRNLVDVGNGNYNLMLLCWDVGQASSIHTHAGSHCFVKVLDGKVVEEMYPPPKAVVEGEELKPNVESEHSPDAVLYISDEIAMHRVSNTSHSKRAVTLHVYSPPYLECKCADQRTGKLVPSGAINFFSKYGDKCDDEWTTNMASSDYC